MPRILVVEDSRTQAEAARAILESAGFEVEVARDGEEGLDLVRNDRFDIVISDIMMPGISGYQLCAAIKSDSRTKHTPVVLLTTLSDPMDIVQGLESGADNFVTKPYEPEYLIERVSTLLENRMLRAEGKLKVGVEIVFLGKKFAVNSDREQILDLLVATFEDVVRTNRTLRAAQAQLSAAKAKIEEYALALEGKVRNSEERYRALMDQASDAIIVFNTKGMVVSANQAAEQLYGAGSELVGRHVSLSPDGDAHFERILSEGNVRQSGIPFTLSTGETRFVDYSASVINAGDEDLVLSIIRDVTEQKELEQRFHQSQKLEAVARLASGAAHDFNNILMAIQTFSEVLSRKLGPDNPSLTKPLDEIRKATSRGAWLTGQLLSFTRGTSGQHTEIDANAVVRNLLPMLEQLVGENIEIAMQLSSNPAMVRVESGHLEQVVMNLVVNARDAMKGGGTITISTGTTRVNGSEPALEAGEYTLLSVSDTGEGMPEDVAKNLFQPFFTTKKKGSGSGLGLSIVEAIVRQSGGHIKVDTAPGRGTTFAIRLPLRTQEADEQLPEGMLDALYGKEHVLVVHSEASIRSLIGELLRSHGYQVSEASTQQELRDVLARERPNLAIAASAEPGITDLLRAQTDLPVIRLTATEGNGENVLSGELSPQVISRDLLANVRARLDSVA